MYKRIDRRTKSGEDIIELWIDLNSDQYTSNLLYYKKSLVIELEAKTEDIITSYIIHHGLNNKYSTEQPKNA